MALYDFHRDLAWFLVLSNAAVGIYSIAAHLWPVLRVRPFWWAVVVAQLSTFAIAIVGVLMLDRYGLELDQFHALYGFSCIVAVGILYSYRGQPVREGQGVPALRARQPVHHGVGDPGDVPGHQLAVLTLNAAG